MRSLVSQLSGDQGVLVKTASLKKQRVQKLTKTHSVTVYTPHSATTNLQHAPSVEARRQGSVVELEFQEAPVSRRDTTDLMEKLQRAMTQVRGGSKRTSTVEIPPASLEPAQSPKLEVAAQAPLRKVGSRSVSGEAATNWLRKTASCLTGRGSVVSAEDVALERRPSEDILLMVQEQHRRYSDIVRQTKSDIRLRQRQNAFLQTQLEAIKKTNTKQKALMRAVDELDGMVLAASKLELKLQSLHEEHEVLKRKVFSNQAAQQALESLGGNRLTIQDDAWHRDLDVFAKLAYAGLLKGHEEEN